MEQPASPLPSPDDEPVPESLDARFKFGAADDQLESDAPADDEPFASDLPCIRCGYNLRGLKAGGQCPECGARIRKSLNFATERILCLACMRPVHPSAAVCPHCKSPMNAAGATANYWKIAPHGLARNAQSPKPKSKPHQLPPPPPAPAIAWIVCLPLAAFFFFLGSRVAADSLGIMLGFAFIGLLLILPAIRASATYQRRHHEYRRQISTLLKQKEALETAASAQFPSDGVMPDPAEPASGDTSP